MGAELNPTAGRRVPVAAGDLAGLDALGSEVEALAVFCFSDQRPLRGVAGFVDWRTCGALSRALVGGSFGGRSGEVMMLPTRGRLGQRRVFAFGLGAVAEAGPQRLAQVCRKAQKVLARAGVSHVVFASPASPRLPKVESQFLDAVEEELVDRVALVLLDRSS